VTERLPSTLAEPAVLFVRRERVFAVPARLVRSLLPTPRVSGFPTWYEPMLGVFAHMGRVYPLLDPCPADGDVRRSSPVAVITTTEFGEVGFVADSVLGFDEASAARAQPLDVAEHARLAREAMRRTQPTQ
jgi:chemotaxis signal transduction protein